MGCLASLSEPIADGFRRALLVTGPGAVDSPANGPGVIVFDRDGNPESLSPPGQDPMQIGARSRVRTRAGSWLLLYGPGWRADRTTAPPSSSSPPPRPPSPRSSPSPTGCPSESPS